MHILIFKYDGLVYKLNDNIREAAEKKKSSSNGRAIKRGGGGDNGRAIKEKKLFLKLFLFCCHLKIKIILL